MASERKPLFRPDVLYPRVSEFQLPQRAIDFRPKLANWATDIANGTADKLTESELLPSFLTDFFTELLGYTGPIGARTRYTMTVQRTIEDIGERPDAVLGDFNGSNRPVMPVEGKGTKDPLDIPYGRPLSAVQQGYQYAINLRCDWILVTSMRQTRLYHKGADQLTYELFETEAMDCNEFLFRQFVFLLGADRVVPESGRCHLYDLLEESARVGKELTKKFYIKYADVRQDTFVQLCHDNPAVPPKRVLECAQKVLDRVLFCAFAEDRGLLPVDTLRKAYEHRDPYERKAIWDTFKSLFRSINHGGHAESRIYGYNGGLFADDATLDSLAVSDEVCGYFRDFGDYDYRPAQQVMGSQRRGQIVDVDILGHIFEQSIMDLERLRNELDGLVKPAGVDQHKTRRKKEGAFYTPAFITRYIVEQSLGRVLQERFEQLRRKHFEPARGSAKAALENPSAYETSKLKKPARDALIRFWEAWQDELATIRVLDPACGSGAFLIQAFDQLFAEYQASNGRLNELRGHRSLFDVDKRILENNLYGVDINEEAIEICRLSLWIKTAHAGRKLTSLDHSIRVGNSVVTDPAVDPLAFDWQGQFPEVFKAGGFDVVVANPPYIRQEWLSSFKDHWESVFQSYHGVADIFTYFFERGLQVLRDGGRLAFITSGSWVRGNFGGPLRKYLAENATIESMIDFGEFQPFEDAEMIRPTVAVVKKQRTPGKMRIFKWLTSGLPPDNLSAVIASAPTMGTEHLGTEAWELDSDEVLALRRRLSEGRRALSAYTGGRIFRGIVSGSTEVFVIGASLRDQLVAEHPSSEEIIRPFVQGTHLRPWYIEESNEYLVFTRRGIAVEEYPAVLAYLERYKNRLMPRPDDWPSGRAWEGRKPGAYKWYEIQDTIDYWREFHGPKIVWPDISKLPRFSMDTGGRYLGNTAFIIPGQDYYLLGILNSWATWFFLSKTAQPLRLRGDRWQYRLFAQYMEQVPVPDASEPDREPIAALACRCGEHATARHQVQTQVQRRLLQAFGYDATGAPLGMLNQKAQDWSNLSLNELGQALKTSFKLPANPFRTPRVADEWEPYLAERRHEVARLTQALVDAEGELNDRVYRVFNLTADEVKLLQREVEH